MKTSELYDIDDRVRPSQMAVERSTGPSKDGLATEAVTWAQRAQGLLITDAPSCINGSELLKSIKGLRAEIQKWFKPHIDRAMETKRQAEAARAGLVNERDRMEAPLVAAEQTLKNALLHFEAEQERVRLEQERALQIEAQRQAELLALEAAAALEREATATGDADKLQEAQAIFDQPTEAPAVSVARTVPKVAGVTYRDNWKAHPDVNVAALAAAVATGEVSPMFLEVNMTALNKFAQATKGTQAIAGVKFYNDRQVVARS